ncbi:MAG: hypothetical protein H6602_03095 [Flavobacteriales bacterium]|nr:hypothetical protein [Flavobacteriales bacterium]
MADDVFSAQIAPRDGCAAFRHRKSSQDHYEEQDFRTWDQFMAEMCMSGQLKRLKELEAIRNQQLIEHNPDAIEYH